VTALATSGVGTPRGNLVTRGFGGAGVILPIILDDYVETYTEIQINCRVLDNDTPPPGDGWVSLVENTPPSNGYTQLLGAGSQLHYTSNPGFTGEDSFTYELCTIAGLCGIATVYVTVLDPNAPRGGGAKLAFPLPPFPPAYIEVPGRPQDSIQIEPPRALNYGKLRMLLPTGPVPTMGQQLEEMERKELAVMLARIVRQLGVDEAGARIALLSRMAKERRVAAEWYRDNEEAVAIILLAVHG